MMLIFTVLEFCLAVLMAVIWWKWFHSDFPGVSVMPCLRVLPGVLPFLGCVELCQQEWQRGPLVAGHEIQMGGGLMVMDNS